VNRIALCLCVALAIPAPARAWNAHGHRIITYLALDGLPANAPQWLRDEQVRHRIAHQSGEPDRWRGWPAAVLGHTNKPDHYLDIELLEQFGLTLETVPPLRNEYLRAMAVSKHLHPEKVDPYDAGGDPDRSREWPGFLPHAICEHYARLQACFMQVRILERIGDPNRAFQEVQARENAIYHMGMLSHFVGDAAQPLHTTKHYNGWVGDNPGGYTTDRGFHAYIDGGVLELHSITYGSVRPHVSYTVRVNRSDPWADVLALLRRSFDCVEPLYRLDRDGELRQEAGRQFITERLADASATLAALYAAAWAGSVPNEKQVADFIRFDTFDPALLPAGERDVSTGPAATQPAPAPPGTP
jgi:hypothetical protein